MKSKFCIAAFLCSGLFASCLLFGCSSSENLYGANSEKSANDTFSLPIDTSTIAKTLNTTPDHVNATIKGVLDVDAPVDIPPIQGDVQNITAQKIIPTIQSCWNLFYSEQPTNIKETTYLGQPWYACSNDEGSMSCGVGSLNFISSNFNSKLYDIALLQGTGSSQLSQEFSSDDLSSLSSEEAKKQVEKVLQGLSLETYGQPEVYALSADRLNELANQNRSTTKMEDLAKMDSDSYSHVYSSDDEVYILRYRAALNGIPVTGSSYQDGSSDSYYSGSTVEAWVSNKGIMRFNVSLAVYTPTPAQESQTIVPLDEALNKAADKYSQVITDSTISIRKIRLEYVPRSLPGDSNTVHYSLTWYLSPGDSEEKYETSIRVDAITGEVF